MSTECRLSDKSQAAVTLYTTAFITIISTISDRTLIESFMMAWIAWLPPVRGAAGVVIYTLDVVDHMRAYFRSVVYGVGRTIGLHPEEPSADYLEPLGRTTETTVLNHIVWWVWHVYIPLSQWIWFVEHRQIANAGVFFARGTAVGVALVGMSFDYKTRVIRAVGVALGAWAALFMCLLSFVTRWSLVGLMFVELIMAAIKSPQVPFIVVYIIFSIIWGSASFGFIQGRDDDSPEDGFYDSFFNVSLILRPVSGLFFACFTCTIAFTVYATSNASNGLSIGAYLKCSSVGRAIRSLMF
jgi:hypothetical protein